jgi:antitoxin component YwqK of YwqJK toxin-antitoxin module
MDGKENGRFVAYFPNGKKEFEKTFVMGEENGTFKKWNKDGQLEIVQEYKNGQLVKENKYIDTPPL